MRLAAAAMVAVVALAGAGCSQKGRFAHLDGKKVPVSARSIDPALWAEAKNRRVESAPGWLMLPLNLHVEQVEIPKGGAKADTVDVRWHDLMPPVFLPFYFSIHQRRFVPDSGEAVGERRLVWHPFAAYVREKGEPLADGIALQAHGFPLVYGNVSIDADLRKAAGKGIELDDNSLTHVSYTNVLWTLGPSVLKMRGQDEFGDAARGYMAAPLLLGGWGALLWSDYAIHSDNEKGSVHGHGPLFGLLGYFQWRDRDDHPGDVEEGLDAATQTFGRLVGAGALWMDHVERNSAGTVTKSAHGPLWGVVGWGRRDGSFTLRVLWVPIKLGFM